MPIFEREGENGSLLISFETRDLVLAGWTGRDQAGVQHHIDELKALGVAPPSRTPLFYRVDPALLAGPVGEITVVGEASSGEAEVVLLQMSDGLWVGLGSDHTDRAFEAHSVQLSKQLCRKPMAATLWSYGEVKDHWDDLMLRAHIEENGDRVLYQEGSLTELSRPNELIAAYLAERGLAPDDGLPVGTALFCGALPAIGGIRPSGRFEMTLDDPVRNERIEHGVDIKALPVIS